MEMKIPLVAISAFVVVIVLGAVLMPVLGDASETERTFTNDGIINMNKVDDSYSETIVWSYATPAKLTIGSDVVDLPTSTTFAVTLMANEDFFVRWFYSGTGGSTSFVQVYMTGNTTAYQANASSSQNMTITIANGGITFDNGSGTTKSLASYTDMYCICSGVGQYVMKASTTTAYLADDSEIFAYGGSYAAGVTFNTIITGDPVDGFTRTLWPDTAPMTATDMENDLADVNGYIGLHSLKQFTFTVTNTNTSTTAAVTYSQFIVPHEVTVELSQHLNAQEIALLGAIPALVIVALLIGVLALYMRSRMD